MNSHSDGYLYPCKLCDKMYREKNSLRKHTIITHSNNVPFKCNHCNKVRFFCSLLLYRLTKIFY